MLTGTLGCPLLTPAGGRLNPSPTLLTSPLSPGYPITAATTWYMATTSLRTATEKTAIGM